MLWLLFKLEMPPFDNPPFFLVSIFKKIYMAKQSVHNFYFLSLFYPFYFFLDILLKFDFFDWVYNLSISFSVPFFPLLPEHIFSNPKPSLLFYVHKLSYFVIVYNLVLASLLSCHHHYFHNSEEYGLIYCNSIWSINEF